MATSVAIDDVTRNDHIASHILPRVALSPFGKPTAQEPPGSIGESSGPTTGQISPRY